MTFFSLGTSLAIYKIAAPKKGIRNWTKIFNKKNGFARNALRF